VLTLHAHDDTPDGMLMRSVPPVMGCSPFAATNTVHTSSVSVAPRAMLDTLRDSEALT
jgi:hypothetical protein